jgi:hypothetical protein
VNKRIEKLIEIIKERMDEPLSKAINWYRSIKIGDTNVSAAVRDFISVRFLIYLNIFSPLFFLEKFFTHK